MDKGRKTYTQRIREVLLDVPKVPIELVVSSGGRPKTSLRLLREILLFGLLTTLDLGDVLDIEGAHFVEA